MLLRRRASPPAAWGTRFFHPRSVAARLTLVSGAVLALAVATAFHFLSDSVMRVIISQVDNELSDELEEFRSICRDGGLEALSKELYFEEQVRKKNLFFACVYARDGRVLTATDLTPWPRAAYRVDDIDGILQGEPVCETMRLEGDAKWIRRLSGALTESTVAVLASSLDPHLKLGYAFRIRFAVVLGLMLAFSILGAWFVASRAMGGVEAVTRTARRIAAGELQQRVAATGHGAEIDLLAETFNTMLDRLGALVAEMRAVNDNIAHELRSPITRIRGTAEVTLLRDSSIEEYRDVTVSIVEECDTLLSLVNGMLDIAEMEAGVTRLDVAPVDVLDMLQDIRDFFSPVAEDRDIVVETSGPAGLMLQADARKLHQAVANLVDNAIKYTPSGGTIRLETAAGHEELRITVTDTGIGIPADDLPHVFERFYRCQWSRSEPGSGLGLGLAKAIVKAHGGSIEVESVVGEGTRFTVILPMP